MCLFTLNGKKRMTMEWYHCRTCRLQDGLGMCKACFEECHPNCDAFYVRIAQGAFCDCHTLRCKFNDKKFVKEKKLKQQVIQRREKLQTRTVELTEEHKAQVKEIYDTIVPVKFRWGGNGFIKVRTSFFDNLSVSQRS